MSYCAPRISARRSIGGELEAQAATPGWPRPAPSSRAKHAAGALDLVPREEREIASLTLCLSAAQFEQLKVELAALRSVLLQRYQSDEAAERVVQLNFQMFPLSRKNEGKE
jgi:hypothetical protein